MFSCLSFGVFEANGFSWVVFNLLVTTDRQVFRLTDNQSL